MDSVSAYMLAIQPASHDSGNEELRAVAANFVSVAQRSGDQCCLRVGASVGHGQQTGLLVLELEVLISELLAVDGLATSALNSNE